METTKEFSKIMVAEVKTSDYQKQGTSTAVLKQVVSTKTTYANNSTKDNLFDTSEFSELESSDYTNDETRVYFMDVPAGTTLQDVQVKMNLARFANARLVKILSNKPILDSGQEYAIANYGKTEMDFAKRQVVKDGSGNHVLRNGENCYRKIVFSANGGEDENLIHEQGLVYSTPESVLA